MAILAFLSSIPGAGLGAGSSAHASLSTFNTIMVVPSDAGDLLLVHRMDCMGSEENPAIGGFWAGERGKQSPK